MVSRYKHQLKPPTKINKREFKEISKGVSCNIKGFKANFMSSAIINEINLQQHFEDVENLNNLSEYL